MKKFHNAWVHKHSDNVHTPFFAEDTELGGGFEPDEEHKKNNRLSTRTAKKQNTEYRRAHCARCTGKKILGGDHLSELALFYCG